MEKTIKLASDQITSLFNEEAVNGFEGWELECNTSEGEYDGEHGAMVDFPITLTSPDGHIYESSGGYYNEGAGTCFNYDLTFELKEETPESKFNEFLVGIAEDEGSVKSKLKKIQKYVESNT